MKRFIWSDFDKKVELYFWGEGSRCSLVCLASWHINFCRLLNAKLCSYILNLRFQNEYLVDNILSQNPPTCTQSNGSKDCNTAQRIQPNISNSFLIHLHRWFCSWCWEDCIEFVWGQFVPPGLSLFTLTFICTTLPAWPMGACVFCLSSSSFLIVGV